MLIVVSVFSDGRILGLDRMHVECLLCDCTTFYIAERIIDRLISLSCDSVVAA